MPLDDDTRAEIEAILAAHNLPHDNLAASDGFANLVVLTPGHVVRLNEGRFPEAFRHEATVLDRLPPEIPHPVAVANGRRDSGGEYLILERLPGINLEQAWPTLTDLEQVRIVRQVGGMIRTLHELPVADWMRNPWVERALTTGRWRDAYHAPPEHFPNLVASAARQRPELEPLLHSVSAFIASRIHAFADEPETFVHTDLHFRNVLVHDGQVTGLIDFEGSRLGRRDTELDMLLRSLATLDCDPVTTRFPGVVPTLADVYPALFQHPHLLARLEVQEALWHLVQLHHWRPGHKWTHDPAESLAKLLDGEFAERTRRILPAGA